VNTLRRFYRAVWVVDCEFSQPAGDRPTPLCLVAHDLLSRSWVHCWLEGTPLARPPFATDDQTLVVAYYASAELGCYMARGWPFPTRVIDLYAEFRNLTSGRRVPYGHGLLGALTAYGLEAMGASDKTAMRHLARRGGPYTPQEQRALLAYCQTDVEGLTRLLRAMLPQLDLPRALLRGRYMAAVARMGWVGMPCDLTTLSQLQAQWGTIKHHLAQAMNRDYPVFLPAGKHPLDARTPFDAAVLRLAVERGLDPYSLAVAADQVWRDTRMLYDETIVARREARRRTGLTRARIRRWEDAGHDYASWPGFDALAAELAYDLPALGMGPGRQEDGGSDDVDYAGSLWALLRDSDERFPQKTDWDVLNQAADLAEADPTGWDSVEPLVFSSERFTQYLLNKGIPWPQLPSGKLALDDDTFKEMARAYPGDIGPIRDVRYALSQMKLHELAVGHDGRNRCLLSAFGSTTGRNQPSTSKYIFGPACWLRSLIKPEPGRAIAYVDWSQQELGIAAGLSQDPAMMAAYQSGDFYLTFAQMAGAAPPGATKATHPTIREQYKTVALGVLYGLSAHGLARRLENTPV
jgi:hypothetical protein